MSTDFQFVADELQAALTDLHWSRVADGVTHLTLEQADRILAARDRIGRLHGALLRGIARELPRYGVYDERTDTFVGLGESGWPGVR